MGNVKLSLEELDRVDVETYKKMDKIPLIVILDDIRSALNVGSVFRTSDCFAIETIILCGITAKPPHKEIFKSAIGATESVDWEYVENVSDAIDSLKNTSVLSIEQTTNSINLHDLHKIKLKDKVAIIMGNEVNGVSEIAISKSDYCIEIPQFGTKHSFNVSVCTGIVLWKMNEILRRLA